MTAPPTSIATAAEPSPSTRAAERRAAILARLADGGGLWPLLPWNPCALCALPRRTPAREPLCDACQRLRTDHGDALADLHPAALTGTDWALLRALRAFKDAPAGVSAAGPHARELAAVLSAFLEVRVGPAGLAPAQRARLLVTAVPSAHPAVPALLARARREGWWTPRLQRVARVRPGVAGQRRRRRAERLRIPDKWIVDAAAVAGRDVAPRRRAHSATDPRAPPGARTHVHQEAAMVELTLIADFRTVEGGWTQAELVEVPGVITCAPTRAGARAPDRRARALPALPHRRRPRPRQGAGPRTRPAAPRPRRLTRATRRPTRGRHRSAADPGGSSAPHPRRRPWPPAMPARPHPTPAARSPPTRCAASSPPPSPSCAPSPASAPGCTPARTCPATAPPTSS